MVGAGGNIVRFINLFTYLLLTRGLLIKEIEKRKVLSWRWKEAIEQLLRISIGREFQMVGAGGNIVRFINLFTYLLLTYYLLEVC